MAQRCATLTEFLALAPEFSTVGSQSSGTVTVAIQPAPGDTFTLSDTAGILPVVEVFTAGVEFAIGATTADTATNLAAAITAGALASAVAIGSVVTIASVSTGPVSLLGMLASDPLSLVTSGATLTGGDAQVAFALSCACAQINLACFGSKADCASVYLAAYFLSTSSGTGGGATVSSKTIDKISVSYAVATPSGSSAMLQSNKWGQLYAQLKSTVFTGPVAGRSLPFAVAGCGCK